MTIRAAAVVLVLLALVACGKNSSPSPTGPSPSASTSALARAYLEEVVGVMQRSSIKRLTIDWNAFRARVFADASTAQTVADTYPAIRTALTLLADGHSSFRTAAGSTIFVPTRSCAGTPANTPTLPDGIGHVYVGAFSGSGDAAIERATLIQNSIRNADRETTSSWIVDLRSNGGGNMWPMVAGLGPILGEDVLGYFIDPVGTETRWEYRDGASWSGATPIVRVPGAYRLRRERPRVAVLVDNGVASSGEATFIAFRRRSDTRSFGVATCGLSTANSGFPISDGALLNLSVAVMADRTKARYGDQVLPDEVVPDATQAVARAVQWLQAGS